MEKRVLIPLMLATLLILVLGVTVSAQRQPTKTDIDLEKTLKDKAGITVDLPEMGYLWREEDFQGTLEEGSASVIQQKIIYFFIHWGPIETEEITPEYVRERIPKLWPSEGLVVKEVKPATVAGHPALFATAVPQRQFYSPNFLVWNCPESGRQFIADMNFNIRYKTPKSYLHAQIDAVTKTLSCHPGAPTSPVPSHVKHYDSQRFGFSFRHPINWYVFENPFGVPHPAYKGIRDRSVGSVIAWLKDRAVALKFFWMPMPEAGKETAVMGGSLENLRAAENLIKGMSDVESFATDAYETINIGSGQLLKIVGLATRKKPEKPTSGFYPKARSMVLLIDNAITQRRLFVAIFINFYSVYGVDLPPDRDIFDRWAYEISKNLEF